MKLHYKSYGHGAPVIVLHGLFGALDNWHAINVHLATEFRVLAVDQRNHGQSPHNPEMSYRAMAEDLTEVLQDENIGQTQVMGHSMGGKTAMTFALLFPERVSKLIVVDIAPRTYPPSHRRILSALLSLELSQFSTRKQIEDALAGPIPDLALRQFLLKGLERDHATGHFRWRMGLKEISQSYERLGERITTNTIFAKPVLFVRGESSDYLVEDDLPAITNLFPLAQLVTIPGAGHLVHIDNPKGFLATVTAFLRSTDGT